VLGRLDVEVGAVPTRNLLASIAFCFAVGHQYPQGPGNAQAKGRRRLVSKISAKAGSHGKTASSCSWPREASRRSSDSAPSWALTLL